MKLFDGGKAPNPRRVSIFVKEKGIGLERVPMDMGAMAHKSDSFTAINPQQTLPTLQLDDGTAITETIAICRYLEVVSPQPSLFGETPIEQAQIEMWQRRVEFGLFMPVAHAFRHIHPAMKTWEVPQVAEWGEANKAKALKFCVFLDEELSTRAFIAGGKFSVADITAIAAVDFMKPARLAVPEDLAHLTEYVARIRSRESMQ